MKLNLLKTNCCVAFVCAMLAGTAVAQPTGNYVPKVYPQQQDTAGKATLTETNGTYTFANSLLSAKFIKQDGKLIFGGSDALNLKSGSELFTVKFGNGNDVVKASQMTLKDVSIKKLAGSNTAVKGSHHFDGVQLVATYEYTYSDSKVTIVWYAELRDGSHYLKTDMTLSTDKDVKMFAVIPMQYIYEASAAGSSAPEAAGNTWGSVLMNDKVFCGLETPMGKNTVEVSDSDENPTMDPFTWKVSDFTWHPTESPAKLVELGLAASDLVGKRGLVKFDKNGEQTISFQWDGGNLRLDVAGVDLVNPEDGTVISSSFNLAYTGSGKQLLPYTINVPEANKTYLLRYYMNLKADGYKLLDGTSTGKITCTCGITNVTQEGGKIADVVLQGLWDRNATLLAVEPWNVSAIVGLVDAKQPRRSFLAYSERERAVPWRPFSHYNSWYELNIDRNNHTNPVDNMNVDQVLDVVSQWKKNLFDKNGVSVQAFVLDDGWDQYGIWEPHAGFPNGFVEFDDVARQMCSGIGAWLGPCGGYGGSGTLRNQYWQNQGGQHRLSYAPFYTVFKNAISNLVKNYDFRYFKFDGISQQYPHPVGPDNNTSGIENCEGIIRAERYVRENVKEDIFFNTTVGTWASPFWFHFTDAVWRGGDDWKNYTNSNTIDREAWITYRDDLIYDYFVNESPMCPINSMMSHGFILTKKGAVAKNMEYKYALNELRCAFACGSGMVELYCDYELLNSIADGALWNDLAECIKWQRENADVLPDIHWVGGDPWTGKTNDKGSTGETNIYGWASWNGVKATLALRNGGKESKNFTFKLRDVLEIPQGVNTTITLTDAFNQTGITGITTNKAYNIDEPITVTLPASSVYVFNGRDGSSQLVEVESIKFLQTETVVGVGSAVNVPYVIEPLNASNKTLTWTSNNTDVATVTDGAIVGVSEGTAVITAKANGATDVSATVTVNVIKTLKNELRSLIEEVQTVYNANETDVTGGNLITNVNQLSANQTESSEGKIEYLIDNNPNTFWHSTWKGVSGNTMDQHYLQVQLPAAVNGTILATQTCRPEANTDFVIACRVDGSNDGVNFTQNVSRVTFDGVSNATAKGKTFTTKFNLESSYKYLRFYISETTSNRVYGHFAEFQLNKVEQEAVNSKFAEAAANLAEALLTARRVREVTQQDIDDLRDAYTAYLEAIGDVPTAIAGALQKQVVNTYYDLRGRAVRPNAHGIYINNGRKIVK